MTDFEDRVIRQKDAFAQYVMDERNLTEHTARNMTTRICDLAYMVGDQYVQDALKDDRSRVLFEGAWNATDLEKYQYKDHLKNKLRTALRHYYGFVHDLHGEALDSVVHASKVPASKPFELSPPKAKRRARTARQATTPVSGAEREPTPLRNMERPDSELDEALEGLDDGESVQPTTPAAPAGDDTDMTTASTIGGNGGQTSEGVRSAGTVFGAESDPWLAETENRHAASRTNTGQKPGLAQRLQNLSNSGSSATIDDLEEVLRMHLASWQNIRSISVTDVPVYIQFALPLIRPDIKFGAVQSMPHGLDRSLQTRFSEQDAVSPSLILDLAIVEYLSPRLAEDLDLNKKM